MQFETYIKKTRETAIYPEDYERDYVIHGLVDELGELKRAVMAPSKNGGVPRRYGRRHISQLCKEMGDALWYLARLYDHFNIETEEHDRIQSLSSIDPEIGEKKIEEALLAAAKINGYQKKSVRDDADKSKGIRVAAKNIMLNLRKAAHHLGVYDIEVVMERNLRKLFDRKDRGVLQGDGDNR
jgi:NTP pyrophosphatase (non-canonical NTP hydrolase)